MKKAKPKHKQHETTADLAELELLFLNLTTNIAEIVAHPATCWAIRNPLMEITNALTDQFNNNPQRWAKEIRVALPLALFNAQQKEAE